MKYLYWNYNQWVNLASKLWPVQSLQYLFEVYVTKLWYFRTFSIEFPSDISFFPGQQNKNNNQKQRKARWTWAQKQFNSILLKYLYFVMKTVMPRSFVTNAKDLRPWWATGTTQVSKWLQAPQAWGLLIRYTKRWWVPWYPASGKYEPTQSDHSNMYYWIVWYPSLLLDEYYSAACEDAQSLIKKIIWYRIICLQTSPHLSHSILKKTHIFSRGKPFCYKNHPMNDMLIMKVVAITSISAGTYTF